MHPDRSRYMIGQEVSLLGLARTARSPVRAVAEPYLRYLAEQAGDTELDRAGRRR